MATHSDGLWNYELTLRFGRRTCFYKKLEGLCAGFQAGSVGFQILENAGTCSVRRFLNERDAGGCSKNVARSISLYTTRFPAAGNQHNNSIPPVTVYVA